MERSVEASGVFECGNCVVSQAQTRQCAGLSMQESTARVLLITYLHYPERIVNRALSASLRHSQLSQWPVHSTYQIVEGSLTILTAWVSEIEY